MNVRELIDALTKLNPDAVVTVAVGMTDGCDTCGYGAKPIEADVTELIDLETRICLQTTECE